MRNWDTGQLEAFARRCKLAPVSRMDTSEGDVLIADGYFGPGEDLDEPEPHYKTMWVLRRDGQDGGRAIVIRPWIGVKGLPGVQIPVSKEERIEIAKKDALQWIEDNREVGRY